MGGGAHRGTTTSFFNIMVHELLVSRRPLRVATLIVLSVGVCASPVSNSGKPCLPACAPAWLMPTCGSLMTFSRPWCWVEDDGSAWKMDYCDGQWRPLDPEPERKKPLDFLQPVLHARASSPPAFANGSVENAGELSFWVMAAVGFTLLMVSVCLLLLLFMVPKRIKKRKTEKEQRRMRIVEQVQTRHEKGMEQVSSEAAQRRQSLRDMRQGILAQFDGLRAELAAARSFNATGSLPLPKTSSLATRTPRAYSKSSHTDVLYRTGITVVQERTSKTPSNKENRDAGLNWQLQGS